MLKDLRVYIAECFSIAWTGSLSLANTWAPIVGGALLVFVSRLYRVVVSFPSDANGLLSAAVVSIAIAWVALFFARLLLWAPFEIYRKHLADVDRLTPRSSLIAAFSLPLGFEALLGQPLKLTAYLSNYGTHDIAIRDWRLCCAEYSDTSGNPSLHINQWLEKFSKESPVPRWMANTGTKRMHLGQTGLEVSYVGLSQAEANNSPVTDIVRVPAGTSVIVVTTFDPIVFDRQRMNGRLVLLDVELMLPGAKPRSVLCPIFGEVDVEVAAGTGRITQPFVRQPMSLLPEVGHVAIVA